MRLADLADDADNCAECGAPLPEDRFWGMRFTCSPACQKRAWARRVFGERACATCGEGFVPRDGIEMYCSRACYHEALRAGPPPGVEQTCPVCGEQFRVHSLKLAQAHCSRKCAWVARKARLAERVEVRSCRVCGKGFYPTHDHQKYCLPKCGRRVRAQRYRAERKALSASHLR